MQHDQSKILTMRKVERTRNGRTPDRLSVRNSNVSLMNLNSPKKKFHTSRMSVLPPSSSSVTLNADLRKMQLENNNLELELLYSQYIASHAEFLLENKNLKEAEESFIKVMRASREETKALLEKYKSLKLRLKDVQAFSNLNDYMDAITKNMTEFKNTLEDHSVEDKLSKLEKALSRFNVLQCQNIILPSTEEEVLNFKKTLKECLSTLQQKSNPEEADVVEKLAENVEEFVGMYNEFVNVKKIVEEKICQLQSEVLKTCSHLLSQCDEANSVFSKNNC